MTNSRLYFALCGADIKSLARLKPKIYAEYTVKSLVEQDNSFLSWIQKK